MINDDIHFSNAILLKYDVLHIWPSPPLPFPDRNTIVSPCYNLQCLGKISLLFIIMARYFTICPYGTDPFTLHCDIRLCGTRQYNVFIFKSCNCLSSLFLSLITLPLSFILSFSPSHPSLPSVLPLSFFPLSFNT